jgi:deoxyhypusine monooxygenase
MRMRATYYLRQLYDDFQRNNETTAQTPDDETKADDALIIDTLCNQLRIPSHGALLRHEFAYVLGQLRDIRALPALSSTLLSKDEDIMVRHECAEALGAIGSSSSIPILKECSNDSSVEVGQTCRLALDFIQWKLNGGIEGDDDAPAVCACMLSPYSSHDPAPAHPAHEKLSTIEIGAILSDVDAPLFQRFRAMFSLRNRGGEDAVHQLGRALISDSSSALLRHEVAYVLGQMQHPTSVEYLSTSLKRSGEHKMVRHESAEALGAIEERWGECEEVLRQFLEDEDVVVRESCMVALDAADYFGYVTEDVSDEVDEPNSHNVNFSLHKAQTNGKVNSQENTGVLHNHFNIVA